MRTPGALVTVCWLGVALTCAAAPGCKSSGSAFSTPTQGSTFVSTTRQDLVAARVQAMAAADTYMTIVAQAADELRSRTKRDEVIDWALQQRTATVIACCTNATGTNDYISLLDMMVLTTLKRYALEEHWIPTLLHEEGAAVLEAYRRGERDVWDLGAKVLSDAQREELRRVIEEWRTANPTQYYVSHIRFTDFANAMRITSSSPQVKVPGSVFSLLYIDPLAGLDPVARELQQYRALTERIVYIANRMPIILAYEVELAVYHATGGPQVVRFVDSTSRFADATTRFSEAVVKLPQELTTERTAAVKQIDAATTQQVKAALDQTSALITEQRQALWRDLDAQAAGLRQILGDVRGIVERADEAGRSVNAATGQTIDTAEGSARRTLNHAFLLAASLLVLTVLSLLSYRLAVKHWALGEEPH